MKFRKNVLLLLIFVLTLSFAVPIMPVEAASNKSKVEKTINTFYSAAKHYNVKKMKSCFTKGSLLKAFVTMKEMAAFCKNATGESTMKLSPLKSMGEMP